MVNDGRKRRRNDGRYDGLENIVKNPVLKTERSTRSEDLDEITPNSIMSAALHDIYGIKSDKSRLDAFSAAVVMLLSALATGGRDRHLFGRDMNDFVKIYVNTVNLCARMKETLEDNGIEFDIGDGGKED